MYQLADSQLIEIMDLLSLIQSHRYRMVPLLVVMIGQSYRLWSW